MAVAAAVSLGATKGEITKPQRMTENIKRRGTLPWLIDTDAFYGKQTLMIFICYLTKILLHSAVDKTRHRADDTLFVALNTSDTA